MDSDFALHRILKDSTRREILLGLNRSGSLSYMELMNLLQIKNTGRFNYHLKILGDLIEKVDDGKYRLTEKGQLAVQFLENYSEKVLRPTRVITRKRVPKKFVVASILVMVICISFLFSLPFFRRAFYGPKVQWQQFLPGISGGSVIQTVDGGYLALGTNASVQEDSEFGSFFVNQEPILVKTDSSGNIVWTKTYSVEGGDRLDLSSIIPTSDGGYALGGVQVIANDFQNPQDKICLIKIDTEGNVQWSKLLKAYNGTYIDENGLGLQDLIQTSDQGYAVVSSYSHTMYVTETWFVKTDMNGNLELNKTITPVVVGYPLSIVEKDTGYTILGSAMGRGGSGGKVTIIKVDSEANVQWYSLHGENTANPHGTSGVATSDGGYTIAGYTYAGRIGWIIHADAQGNMVWDANYSYRKYPSTIQSISQTDDGGYIFVGTATKAIDFGVFDADTRLFTWVVKVGSFGEVQGEVTIEMGNHDTHPDSIIQTKDGGYAFVGTWNETHQASTDQRFWLVKIASFTYIPTFVWHLIGALTIAVAVAVEVILVTKFFRKRNPQSYL